MWGVSTLLAPWREAAGRTSTRTRRSVIHGEP